MNFSNLVRTASVAAILALGVQSAAQAIAITPGTSYSAYTHNWELPAVYAGDAAQGEMSRMYNKFVLPAFSAGTVVQSAIFHVDATSRYNWASNPLGVYAVNNDAWMPTNSWAIRPVLGDALASFNPGQSGGHFAFDVTAFINSQYLGDGTASLAIAGLTEGMGQNSWTYFDQRTTNLELTLAQAAAVPEPASIALFGLGLAGLAGLRRRRK